MTKKETFINEVLALTGDSPESIFSPDALDFWNGLQLGNEGKSKFTENGKIVLSFMKENKDNYNNLFQSKTIGEAIGISSRTVSGAMRKLVTDGFVEKLGQNPVTYSLTQSGVDIRFDEEES